MPNLNFSPQAYIILNGETIHSTIDLQPFIIPSFPPQIRQPELLRYARDRIGTTIATVQVAIPGECLLIIG